MLPARYRVRKLQHVNPLLTRVPRVPIWTVRCWIDSYEASDSHSAPALEYVHLMEPLCNGRLGQSRNLTEELELHVDSPVRVFPPAPLPHGTHALSQAVKLPKLHRHSRGSMAWPAHVVRLPAHPLPRPPPFLFSSSSSYAQSWPIATLADTLRPEGREAALHWLCTSRCGFLERARVRRGATALSSDAWGTYGNMIQTSFHMT